MEIAKDDVCSYGPQTSSRSNRRVLCRAPLAQASRHGGSPDTDRVCMLGSLSGLAKKRAHSAMLNQAEEIEGDGGSNVSARCCWHGHWRFCRWVLGAAIDVGAAGGGLWWSSKTWIESVASRSEPMTTTDDLVVDDRGQAMVDATRYRRVHDAMRLCGPEKDGATESRWWFWDGQDEKHDDTYGHVFRLRVILRDCWSGARFEGVERRRDVGESK